MRVKETQARTEGGKKKEEREKEEKEEKREERAVREE